MSETENSQISTAVWSDETCRLKDFSQLHDLPAIAHVRTGHYRDIGQSDQNVYIHSIKTGQKVLGESLRQNSALTRKVRTTLRYSVPVSYAGWFEVLSEDGKQIQPIQSVEELSKIAPQQCLVREPFKAPFCSAGSEAISTEQVRQVSIGERLSVVGEVNVAFQGNRGSVAKKSYLRCVDEKGDNVFLGIDLRGHFSPIAGPNNISGVHTIKGLLEKFRFPIVVRLVYGTIPARVQKNFSPVFRLVGAYTDETAFVMPLPLRKETKMVTISTREPLLLSAATNWKTLRDAAEFSACEEKCSSSVKSYLNSIHVLVDIPDPEVITRGRESPQPDQPRSDDTPKGESEEYEELLFDEIEDIYRYVREGGDPPPRRKPRQVHPNENQSSDHKGSEIMESQEAMMDLTAESTSGHNPAGGARLDHLEEDEYWEEPIYEEIAKIRERKQADKTTPGNETPETTETKTPETKLDEVKSIETKLDDPKSIETKLAGMVPMSGTPELLKKTLKIDTKTQTGIRKEVERNTEMISTSPKVGSETIKKDFEPKLGLTTADNMVQSLRQVYRPNCPPIVSTKVVSPRMKPETVGVEVAPEPRTKFLEEGRSEQKSPVFDVSSPLESSNVPQITPASSQVREMPNRTTRPKSQPPKVLPKKGAKKPENVLSEPVNKIESVTHTISKIKSIDVENSQVNRKVNPTNLVSESVNKLTVANQDTIGNLQPPVELKTSTNQHTVRNAPTFVQHSEAYLPVEMPTLSSTIPPTANRTSILEVTKSDGVSIIQTTKNPFPISGTLSSRHHVSPSSVNQNRSTSPAQNIETPVTKSEFTFNSIPLNSVPTNLVPPNSTVFSHPVLVKGELTNTISVKQSSVNTVSSDHRPPTTPDFRSTVRGTIPQGSDLHTSLSEPQNTPIAITTSTTSTSRVNWTGGQGAMVQVGMNSGSAGGLAPATSGVTMIRVSGSSVDPRSFYHGSPGYQGSNSGSYFHGSPGYQGSNSGNTQIFVRLPNSPVGQTLYRTPGAQSGVRVQSGTVTIIGRET